MFGETLSVIAYKNSKHTVTDLAAIESRVAITEGDILDLQNMLPTVSNISIATVYPIGNFYISADASGSGFTITLPDATLASGYEYTITKVDTTSNVITISSVSLLAGEATQDLLVEQESLTFFSNGISWIVK